MVPKNERFEMRLDNAMLEQVDEWRSGQSDVPSRAEAMRRLIEHGLMGSTKDTVRFTDGEKVLIIMMRDVYKHLKLSQTEIDPEFVAEVIWGGHNWAAKWQMPDLFHGEEDDPRDLSFVLDVLEMWEYVERGYEKLSKGEKATLAKEAAPFGKDVRFFGFDGNNEGSLVGIARFLVKNMNRFTRFADRDFNAHMPTVDIYRRMLAVFRGTRNRGIPRELGFAQLKGILLSMKYPGEDGSVR